MSFTIENGVLTKYTEETGVTAVVIPAGVTRIGDFAFIECRRLTSITFEEGSALKSIGEDVFHNCRSLTSIEIPAGVTSIGWSVFSNCSSLTSITIPAGVTSIRDHAFDGCSSLTSITIPAGVTSIGKSVFDRCSNLGSILNYSECYWHSLTSKADRLIVLKGYLQNYSDFDGREIEKTYIDYLVRTKKDNLYLVFEHDSVEVLEKILMKSKIKPLEFDEICMKPAQKAKATQCIAYLVDWQNKNITFEKVEKAMEKELTKDPFNVTDMKKLWKYEKLENGTIRIDEYKGKDEQVIIPERIGKDIVTSIGDEAFNKCSSLTSITIPAGVTRIGERAFDGCSSLTSITIPSGVESIGEYAFAGKWDSMGLTSITFEEGSALKSIGDYAFYNCSSLTSITIPSGVESIGGGAFSYCGSLTSITIPRGVESIGDSAFYFCSSLTSITIPSGVESIGEKAFKGCRSLTSITIEEGSALKSIGNYAFNKCSSLTSITIPRRVESIGEKAFEGCSKLTSITIPSGVESIGDHAFSNCRSLTSITFEEGSALKSIGDYAFDDCSSLERVYISDISDWLKITFSGGSSNPLRYAKNLYIGNELVEELEIPAGITEIKSYAFYYCSSITSITIPSGVESIGEDAFYNCSSLTSITFEEGSALKSIGNNAFYRCSSITSITIPSGVESIGYEAFSGTQCIEQSKGISYVCKWVVGCDTSISTAKIREDTVGIAGSAFYNCSSLTSITIPAGVTSIGDYAFCGCRSLTSITIPDSVTHIGLGCFASAKCVEKSKGVSYVDKWVIDCDTSITQANLRENTVGIADDAFYYCRSLTSITIPSGVESIGRGAFSECSCLRSIKFEDTSNWEMFKTSPIGMPAPVGIPAPENILADEGQAAMFFRKKSVFWKRKK